MQLRNYLTRLKENSLIVMPGDRSDLILGALQANISNNYPAVSGIVLTGDLKPEPAIVKLIEGLTRRIPILLVKGDTYSVSQLVGDIHAQIYARDFVLIDQSDMIISYIPQMPDGKPHLSSGVERELQHAHEATKEVYVIWRPDLSPSPFITETASAVFTNLNQALDFFARKGYL